MLRDRYSLKDGDTVCVKFRLGKVQVTDRYLLTSGGDIRTGRAVGRSLAAEANANPNRAIKFEILDPDSFQPSLDDFSKEMTARIAHSLKLPSDRLHERLKKARKLPVSREVTIRVFDRNPDVVAFVLLRAKGKCETCKEDAPFKRRVDGTPYLEVHHRKTLASGGQDTVKNCVANCPNCHRKAHWG